MAFERRKTKYRPPVSGELRRLPGQSVREELDKALNENLSAYLSIIVAFFLLAGWEWFRWWSHSQPQPLLMTSVAVCVFVFSTARMLKLRREIRNLAQAEKGERRVSELLRELRGKDYVTFDDLVAENSNIDHVVVGPGGVFAIETKAWSIFGNRRVSFAENGLLKLSDKNVIGDPLKQARSSAAIVSEELGRHLRRKIWVEPVLILPGWQIDPPRFETDVVVLNEKTISEFFKTRPEKLRPSEIREICSHLDRSARS
jgi:hypothetical protein